MGGYPAPDMPHLPQQECAFYEQPIEALGVTLAAAQYGQRVYFGLVDICEGLGVDEDTQRQKVYNPEHDYAVHLAMVPFYTPKGWREKLALDFTGMAKLLANIQSGRVKAEARQRVQAYQEAVWTLAGAILRGEVRAMPTPERGASSGLLLLEGRLNEIEAVTLAPGSAGVGSRTATCPHCGGALVVQVGTLRVIKG